MSQQSPARKERSLVLGAVLTLVSAGVAAQTIGEYSQSQRAPLIAEMDRAAAALRAGNAAATASATAASAPPPASASVIRVQAPPAEIEPFVAVSGVSEVRGKRVAEVIVEGGAYMLEASQRVPGTDWTVESVEIRRVVLSRNAKSSPSANSSARQSKTGDATGGRAAFRVARASTPSATAAARTTRVFEFGTVEKGA